jgi:putative ABC transport system ATP-binding protein
MIWKMTTTSPTTPPALQVRGLCKRYAAEPASVDVLKGIELELAPAAFEAVMGSSGSGKSTLLHLLAGLLSADEGEIIIGGESITGMDDETATIFRRRRIGLVFQDFNLIPTLTAEENITLPLLLERRAPDPETLEPLLERLALTARRRHLPSRLSGGERQRVAIARALVNNPAIVLADEPTGNLDAPASRAFCDLLSEMNEATGCTILLVSHDPIVAAAADRVHILCGGRLAAPFDTLHDSGRVAERYLASMHG